jgi:hypothetical protein
MYVPKSEIVLVPSISDMGYSTRNSTKKKKKEEEMTL